MQALNCFSRASYTKCFVVRAEGRKSGHPKLGENLEVASHLPRSVCTSRAVHTRLTQACGCGFARPHQSGDGCPIARAMMEGSNCYPDCQQESRQSSTPPGQSRTRRCTPSHQDVRRAWCGTDSASNLGAVICMMKSTQNNAKASRNSVFSPLLCEHCSDWKLAISSTLARVGSMPMVWCSRRNPCTEPELARRVLAGARQGGGSTCRDAPAEGGPKSPNTSEFISPASLAPDQISDLTAPCPPALRLPPPCRILCAASSAFVNTDRRP